MLQEERFVQVHGFPGYFVSNHGRVWSDRTEVKGRYGMRKHRPRMLREQACGKSRQYLFVVLCVDGVSKSKKVAHLVAEGFLGPRPESHDVDHINGDTFDNRACNLRYLHKSINRGLRHAK